jgi:hypothetical protein
MVWQIITNISEDSVPFTFKERKKIILKLALAGNELTFPCPAAPLPTGQMGWTEGLNAG